MNDRTWRSGNEPSLGGKEMQQLREALDQVSVDTLTPYDNSSQIDLDKLLKERIVVLTSVIDDEVAEQVIARLLFLDRQRRGANIILIIRSQDGQVYSGLAIFDAITSLHSPVTTIGTGIVAGIALLSLIAGTKGKRYLMPNCVIVRTPIRGGRHIDPASIEQARNQLRDKINSYFLEYTAMSQNDLDASIDQYLGPNEAINLGLADHIVQGNIRQIRE